MARWTTLKRAQRELLVKVQPSYSGDRSILELQIPPMTAVEWRWPKPVRWAMCASGGRVGKRESVQGPLEARGPWVNPRYTTMSFFYTVGLWFCFDLVDLPCWSEQTDKLFFILRSAVKRLGNSRQILNVLKKLDILEKQDNLEKLHALKEIL